MKAQVDICGHPQRRMGSPEHTNRLGKPITILMADDDLEDCKLAQITLRETRLANDLRFVHNGQQLMDYLRRQGEYAGVVEAPRPGLILLDLNMPRMDGRTALKEIRSDPNLCDIPVAVLTLSNSEEDVSKCLEMGANAYLVKPVRMEALIDTLQVLNRYWFEIIEEIPD